MQACSIIMKSPDVNLQLLLYNYYMVLQAFSTFIILLDSLISQMKNRFSDDHYLVPSLKQNGTKSIYDITEDLLQSKKYIPFPASLQNEFQRWQLLWCTKNDVPNTFLHAC